MKELNDKRLVISTTELIKITGLCRSSINRLVARGVLKPVSVFRNYRLWDYQQVKEVFASKNNRYDK